MQCSGDVCGLFRITWAYWADAGKPTQPNEDKESATAYPNCANEPHCAARAVQGYMAKFQQVPKNYLKLSLKYFYTFTFVSGLQWRW